MPRPSRQNRNAEVDFRGEKRTSTTHAATTDPDARLYRISPGTGAMLCFIGHALMDMRHVPPPVRGTCRLRSGLIVQGDLTQADGHAQRKAALDMIHRHAPGTTPKLTLGADKGYGQVRRRPAPGLCHATCRARQSRYSVIDGRTTRHEGYALSIRSRKRIEEAFGGAKTIGGMAQTVYRGVERVRARFISPWPRTPLPDYPDCWQHDETWPRARRPSASQGPTLNAESRRQKKTTPDRRLLQQPVNVRSRV